MYAAVEKFPDFPALEQRLLALWEQTGAFQQLVDKNRGKPRWSFLDGPITANNPMGVHHAWGRSLKDMVQRFRAMCGHELASGQRATGRSARSSRPARCRRCRR